MISSNVIKSILSPKKEKNQIKFIIGKNLQYGLKIDLPWNKIFNTHIGIFGNTGSGKSNTLTNLYKILLNHEMLNLKNSKFVFIDFNGEYIRNEVLCSKKITYELNTQQDNKGGKFPIKSSSFWDEEVLSILFHATEKTQKPFLKNLIKRRNKYLKEIPNIKENLESYIKKIYSSIFSSTNPKKEILELIKKVLQKIEVDTEKLKQVEWHSKSNCFKIKNMDKYSGTDAEYFKNFLNIDTIEIKEKISPFDELEIRTILDLISGVLSNFVQYDNINPLLSRIESISVSLKKIIDIVEKDDSNKNNLEVISLRNCNQEIKKMFPILLAKEYFREHKTKNESDVKNTFHLIIDEAHNILSQQSNREAESWKDYRLELFEEIIKEGRKFGFFLTVASQRPADISETIMSQFHNFFIHRLINEKDLRLIDNVISTLDRNSKQLIPVLPQGACIVTGTAFDFPQIVQVDKIENREERPNSDDIDLEELWEKNEKIKYKFLEEDMEENTKKVILKYLEQITGDKKLTRLIVGIVSLIVTYFPIKEMYKTIKLSQIRDYYHLSDEILELDFVDGYKLIFLGLLLTIIFGHARIFFSKEKISRILISIPLIFVGNIIMIYLIIYYLGNKNYFLVELLLENPKFTIVIIGFILYITFLKEGDLVEIINFIKHPIQTIKNEYKNFISISESNKNIPKLVKFERFIKFLGISYIFTIFSFSTVIVLFKNINEKKVYSYFKNVDTEEIEVIIFKLDKKYIIQEGKIEGDNLILYYDCTYQLSKDKLDRIVFNTKTFNHIDIKEK